MGSDTMVDCVAGEWSGCISKADWRGLGAGRGAETLSGSKEDEVFRGVVLI